jgi:hypothetical protein
LIEIGREKGNITVFIVSDSARDEIKKVMESEQATDKQLILYLQGAG